MRTSTLLLSVFCLLVATSQAAHYAVLVAGSSQFYNYRHQSDVFHAYQLLTGYGIDPANIVTMAYDDIAADPENPFPGQVFNKPNGTDVYKGVVIDYKGNDVTPQNFLYVLQGNSSAVGGKKVLQSTKSDNVFIYFADHGAPGLIAFPNDYLYATDLITTLNGMSGNQTYKELVIYVEACESGSMFDGILPSNISIYATTAANSEESSWATYCPPSADFINGTEINSCLGDLYSVNFLENLEAANPKIETLEKQFNIVVNETTESHVQQFGDLSIDKERIGNFEGNNKFVEAVKSGAYRTMTNKDGSKSSIINSRDVKLAYLQRRHQKLQTPETAQAVAEELASIENYDNIFSQLRVMFQLEVNEPLGEIHFECLKERIATFESLYGRFSDYGLKYVKYLALTCSQGVSSYDLESALISLF